MSEKMSEQQFREGVRNILLKRYKTYGKDRFKEYVRIISEESEKILEEMKDKQ